MTKIQFSCANCGRNLLVGAQMRGARVQCPHCHTETEVPPASQTSAKSVSYKVEEVAESGCSALLFGSSRFPSEKLQAVLNRNAAMGWQFDFMSIETRPRFLGLSRIETAIVIFSRTTSK